MEGLLHAMELRKHPLMSYRDRPNWPPRGEVGILKEVSKYSDLSSDGLTLVMEYNGSFYMGVLLFDDFAFFRKIFDLLKTLRNHPITEIGGLDIDATG